MTETVLLAVWSVLTICLENSGASIFKGNFAPNHQDDEFNKTTIKPDNAAKDKHLNITQLARINGYDVERHEVTTEDGYILGLHRLKSDNVNSTNGIPVFLMHGLLDSSDSWILQGSDNALGYLLVNEGYDVWMGNARGNKHSLSHTFLSPNKTTFWNFSWEEIGTYDLPAMIDYVLCRREKESLYYIGHSQGTTTFFAMSSLKPDYGRKVKMMFALSPVAWISHADSPLLKYLSSTGSLLQYFQFFNTLTSPDALSQIYGIACTVISTGCSNIFELLFGTNYFVSAKMLPIILENASTSSVLQIVHYWQLYQSGRFCRYDYGWVRNLVEYNRFSPPDYDLSQVGVPIVLFFSGNDRMSNPSDVFELQSRLPNVYKKYYSQYFSHIDYMYASVAKDAVYDKIIEEIRNFEQHQ